MSEPKPLAVAYDIEANPTADEFDPIAWFEGTGEDRGLPDSYRERVFKDAEVEDDDDEGEPEDDSD